MKLKTMRREQAGTNAARGLRKQQRVPAVVYGHGESQAITLAAGEVEQMIHKHQRIVEFEHDGGFEQAMVQDVQFDTFGREVLHVDFKRVSLDEVVRLVVGLNFSGTPKGVIAGGVCDYILVDLEVECKARDIPEEIEVPIEQIELGQVLHVDELVLPEGVRAVGDLRAGVVQVVVSKKQKAEAGAGEEAAAEAAPAEPAS